MKAFLVTMGCPKNLVDSEAAVSLLAGSGCTMAESPEDADLLMVSACSFLDVSWRETVSEVERLARVRRPGEQRLILMGCLPRHRDLDLAAELPDVDHFLPSGAHAALPDLVREWREERSPARILDTARVDRFASLESRELLTAPHTAYVKVAEGCNRGCAFCAIPTIRGRQLTRPMASIVREVEGLVSRGVREVCLLAQDMVAWHDDGNKLQDLVAAVAGTGVDWVRIYYFHPAGIDAGYVERLLSHDAVVPYLEMPVQHASTGVLRRMNRSHDRAHLERLLRGVRAAMPDIVVRSEVIVGFPGETDDEFDELRDFVQEFEFDSLGIFPYSREPGTAAAAMDAQIDDAVIRSRVEELTALQEAVSYGARARFEGKRLRVLVDRQVDGDEGMFDGCRWAGRFYGQAPGVDGEVYVEAEDLAPGRFVEVDIVESAVYDLKGVPAAAPAVQKPPL